MHVYVVMQSIAHEGGEVIGVYSTLPKAMGSEYADWEEDHTDHWSRKSQRHHVSYTEITKWTVDEDHEYR